MTLSLVPSPVPLNIDQDGRIRVGNTRILLELVIEAFNAGHSPEEIAMQYDVLNLADIYAVIAYYLHHQKDVDAYIQQQDEAAALVKKSIEMHQGPNAVRQRLIALRSTNQ